MTPLEWATLQLLFLPHLGMAVASRLKGELDRQVVAVIGDGAMTAGLAFEGLNHGGWDNANMIVVLNDNCMSIDPNVGALKEYLTDITTSHTYNRVKDEVWNLLGKISKFGPNAQAIAHKISESLKGSLIKESNFFESLKWRYFGPIDGHDVEYMVKVLRDLKDIPGPKILHCVTMKGKGYEPAEKGSPTKWHSPGLFNKETGEIVKGGTEKPTTTLISRCFWSYHHRISREKRENCRCNARHAQRLFAQIYDGSNARSRFRRGYCRATCRDFFRRYGHARIHSFLQHLLEFHAKSF
jgi:deoxyxylulose-5-phosphate synthase